MKNRISGPGFISGGIREEFLDRAYHESLGQHDADQRHDDPLKESDYWIQNPQIKEPDDNKEPVRLQAGEKIQRSL